VGEPQQQDGGDPIWMLLRQRGFATHVAVFTRRSPAVARSQPTTDPFDGQEDYYPFLKIRYNKCIPQTGTTTFLPPPDSHENNIKRGKNVAEAENLWDNKEWGVVVPSGAQSNAGSSRHPFQEDSTVDSEDSDESAPPQDEFPAADLKRADPVSQATYEQGAMKLLQDTLFQIGTPDSQISVPDTKPNRHLETFQLVSMLLQYRDDGDEVTATDNNDQRPPHPRLRVPRPLCKEQESVDCGR